MDTECRGPQPGGSSCWATGAAAWSSSQQKRQRCEQLADKFDDLDLPPGVEALYLGFRNLQPMKSRMEPDELAEDEITKKYKAFQQFYTVEKFSDHHFANKSVGKPEWTKRIQHDWKLLEKDLPASIFVRVAEDRMDLLRAAIIGPKEHPTMMASSSSMHILPLIILLSLRLMNTATGQQHSIEYNKTTFLHSCRTMLYSLRRPPEHFGDLVAATSGNVDAPFWQHANTT
ncbi:hypothetical protein ZWY2020_034445 [Hordeum vulgare]|nr:hypothetical protein ZWY2020_034445 [Hordeum vulgare]